MSRRGIEPHCFLMVIIKKSSWFDDRSLTTKTEIERYTNMKLKTILALSSSVLLSAWTSQAVLIADWTFETSVPTTAGPYVAEGGVNAATSFASGLHAGASVYSNPAGAGSAESFSSTAWAIGDYYQFTSSTIGY